MGDSQNNSNNRKPVVVGLSGSLRTGSYARMALKTALEGAREAGAEVILYDPKEKPLPLCDGEGNKGDTSVEEFRKLILHADGLILATPEYHGSQSGVMKNMLDLLSFDELSDKVCGLISVLGGQSNSNALNHLRVTLRWVHAWVIPHQTAIGRAWQAFDEDEGIVDEKQRERVQRIGADVVKYCHRLRHQHLPANQPN